MKNEATGSTLLAEIVPQKLLPRVLGQFDLVVLYFALIFGSYGAAQMAAGGWAGIPMMLLAAVTFLLPCVLAAYELGTLFPSEGGIYVWAHKTAGPVHGFVAGWLSWVPIFLLLPLGATTILAHFQFVIHRELSIPSQVLIQCLVVFAVASISMMRLKASQTYLRLMFFVSFATALAALAAGILTRPAATPIDTSVFSLDLRKYGSLYSAAVLWLLGVEVPFNMSAEFRSGTRSIGRMFFFGTVALLICYLIGTAGILWSTPQASIDGTTGVAGAVARLSTLGGGIVGIAIILAVSSQDVAYMNSYSRLLFISGIEKRLPSLFGQVTVRSRVPVPALLAQALGAIVVILIFASQPNLAVAFNFYIGALIVVWCMALFYIYFGVIVARLRFSELYKERGQDVWRIPGGIGGVTLVAIWGTVSNIVAIYYVFAIPMTQAVKAQTWRGWLALLVLLVAAIGVLIYVVGRTSAAEVAREEELINHIANEAGK